MGFQNRHYEIPPHWVPYGLLEGRSCCARVAVLLGLCLPLLLLQDGLGPALLLLHDGLGRPLLLLRANCQDSHPSNTGRLLRKSRTSRRWRRLEVGR